MFRLDINLTVVINAVQLHRVWVDYGAVVLTDVSPQVVFPVISAVAHRTRPDFGLRVLRVDVTLQTLLVMEGFVTVDTLVIPQILVSISHVSVEDLHRLVDCTTQVTNAFFKFSRM